MDICKAMVIPLNEFKEIIEKETDGLKTVCDSDEYMNVYIIHSEKAEESNIFNQESINEILSRHFGVNVITWHANTKSNESQIWIIFKPHFNLTFLDYKNMQDMMTKHGRVMGTITTTLVRLTKEENLLEYLSKQLTGSTKLKDIRYELIDVIDKHVIIQVSGDASDIVNRKDELDE